MLPFHHHPDQRLGAGLAQQHPATPGQFLLGCPHRSPNLGILQRILTGGKAHVDQHLGELADPFPQAFEIGARGTHRLEYLQCGNDAIPCGGLIQADDVAGVLATKVPVTLLEQFHHVTVTDLGTHEGYIQLLRITSDNVCYTKLLRNCAAASSAP